MSAKAIIIIDDDVDLVNLFKEALELNELNVCAFTDPLEALNHIENNPELYSLVISDYRMPSMNGLELCTKLVNLYPKLSIILMSAYITLEFDIPQFTCIRKPITIPRLLKTVNDSLAHKNNKDVWKMPKRKLKTYYDSVKSLRLQILETFFLNIIFYLQLFQI